MALGAISPRRLALALGLVLAAACLASPVLAAGPTYAAWKAANPGVPAKIAKLKTGTAALVAAAGPKLAAVEAAPMIWRPTPGAPLEIWDGPDVPQMVVIPAGEYTMGSPDSEPGRRANENPSHRVRIARPFAVSKYAITVGQFTAFVEATGYKIKPGQCYFYHRGHYQNANACTWKTPGFEQTDDSPVVGISWTDSRAYVAWLSKTTGHSYRLLSEAEFEYANRGGTTTTWWWGNDPLGACANTNGADQTLLTDPQFPDWNAYACSDGHIYTTAVDGLKANPFGLVASTGNAWSWTDDCWHDSYEGAPTDGSAWVTGPACHQRVVRGASWADTSAMMRSASRNWNYFEVQPVVDGLRVARDL